MGSKFGGSNIGLGRANELNSNEIREIRNTSTTRNHRADAHAEQ